MLSDYLVQTLENDFPHLMERQRLHAAVVLSKEHGIRMMTLSAKLCRLATVARPALVPSVTDSATVVATPDGAAAGIRVFREARQCSGLQGGTLTESRAGGYSCSPSSDWRFASGASAASTDLRFSATGSALTAFAASATRPGPR